MNAKKMTYLLSFLLLTVVGTLSAETYKIDPAHSDIGFKIKHLVISKVQGRFDQFSGEFNYDGKDPSQWSAQAEIQATSVNTNIADRDKHLRSADFFDVNKYPTLAFKSTKVSKGKDGKIKLAGNLTLHGVTKEVILDVEEGGTAKDPWGNTRAGFEATGKLNRKDFGLTYNKVLETGGLLVGEEVEISIRVEGILQKPQ